MPTENYPFTDQQLKDFAKQLRDQRQRTTGQLNQLEQEMTDINGSEHINDDYGEDGKRAQINERLVELISTHRQQLQRIEAALLRIENRTFGLDERTGNPIQLARLEADPTVTQDIN